MTKQDWLSVGLKTVGVMLVIVYLGGLVASLGFLLAQIAHEAEFERGYVAAIVFSLVAMAVGIAVSILLVTDGDGLARRLTSNGEEADDVPVAHPQRALFLVAIRVIGVVCVARGVVRLLINAGQRFVMAEFYPSTGSFTIWCRQVAWPLVLLVIGIWLVFGGRLLMRLAYGNGPRSSDDADPLGWKPRELFSVALRVLGVVFLTVKLPSLVYLLVVQVFPLTAEALKTAPDGKFTFDTWGFVGALLVVVVSVYFIRGARHFTRLVFRSQADVVTSNDEGEAA